MCDGCGMRSNPDCPDNHSNLVYISRRTSRFTTSLSPQQIRVYGSDLLESVEENWFECASCKERVAIHDEVRFT
jgi:hypothetical protein